MNPTYKIQKVKGEWKVFEITLSFYVYMKTLVFKSKDKQSAVDFVNAKKIPPA